MTIERTLSIIKPDATGRNLTGEINTLIEVQAAVQDASQGYLFLPWNNSLSEP